MLFRSSTTWTNFTVGSGSYHGAFEDGSGTIAPAGANFFEAINGTDTQGLAVSSNDVAAYDNAAAILANKEAFNFNVLLTPGLNQQHHATAVGKFVDLVEGRGDAIYVADLTQYGASVANATSEAGDLNSSYAAAYWPWVKIQAQGVGRQVWAPASDRKSTRLNSSHVRTSRMPSSA